MKRQRLFLNLALLIVCLNAYSQDFVISDPRLEFDGYQLTISYDLIHKNPSDIFYLWVDMKNQAGQPIRAKAFTGDIGDSIKPGNNKMITWIPEDDAIFLDEDVTVELTGERYEREFNKGSMVLLSTAVPGLGQTKISKGKPYWIAGAVAYGAVAGGILMHSSYSKTYDQYLAESDAVERTNLYDKSQSQLTLSTALLISAAAIWVGNIVWVSATPNHYKPLQRARVGLTPARSAKGRVTMLSLKIDF
jgi:hypothetical protein